MAVSNWAVVVVNTVGEGALELAPLVSPAVDAIVGHGFFKLRLANGTFMSVQADALACAELACASRLLIVESCHGLLVRETWVPTRRES